MVLPAARAASIRACNAEGEWITSVCRGAVDVDHVFAGAAFVAFFTGFFDVFFVVVDVFFVVAFFAGFFDEAGFGDGGFAGFFDGFFFAGMGGTFAEEPVC